MMEVTVLPFATRITFDLSFKENPEQKLIENKSLIQKSLRDKYFLWGIELLLLVALLTLAAAYPDPSLSWKHTVYCKLE